MNSNTNIELDYGNCGIVGFRRKEAYDKSGNKIAPDFVLDPGREQSVSIRIGLFL